MKVTRFPMGLFKIACDIEGDNRGRDFRSIDGVAISDHTGIGALRFVQQHVYHALPWTIRGLYYQRLGRSNPDDSTRLQTHATLLRSVSGKICIAAVDLRSDSATYGQAFIRNVEVNLGEGMLIPYGFAFGFMSSYDPVIIIQDSTMQYVAEDQCTLKWDAAGVMWPAPPAHTTNIQVGAREHKGVSVMERL